MDIFNKAKTVRLRSHHGKYLLADEDQETVFQERTGTCKNARWTVEMVEGYDVVRLKSCYGKYLTAMNSPLYLGLTGKKVQQTLPKRLDSSVEWLPVRQGPKVRLKSRYGLFLRANGRLPPWRNSITHDIPHRSKTREWIMWNVDVLEVRAAMAPAPLPLPPSLGIQVPGPSREAGGFGRSDSCVSTSSFNIVSPDYECFEAFAPSSARGRIIYYSVADDKRKARDADEETSFTFKGTVLDELKEKLQEETGINDDLIICSRNPLNGKLYPLHLHLPPNNANMHVVVVPSSSKVARELQATP